MSAISATSVNMRTMADGSLRIQFEISPTEAQDAFRLFASPGTPVAIAALTPQAAQKAMQSESIAKGAKVEPEAAIEPLKGGKLAKLAGIWGNDENFRSFVESVDEDCEPVEWIYSVCGIKSRVQLDHEPEAARLFHHYVRLPYAEWLRDNGK